MPAPKFLSGLPKPVLFGLYGAVGGLLGALAFGEPLYRVLEPPKVEAGRPQPQIAVAASPEVQLLAGKANRNTFGVEVARAEYDGPVTVRFEGLPAGVTAEPVVIPKGATKGTVTVAATAAVGVTKRSFTAIAEAEAGGKKLTAETTVGCEVITPQPQADVFFVLDVTQSMDWAIAGVRDGIAGFAAHMRANNINFRVGLIAYRDLWVQEPSQTLHYRTPGGGSAVFTDDPAEFAREVNQLRADGGGDAPESTLDAVIEACGQPFRKGATKVLMVITDNPPKNIFRVGGRTSHGQIASADDVRTAADRVKGANIDFVHLVVPPNMTIYRPLQDAATGRSRTFDLRTAASGGAGFNNLVSDFSREVAAAAAARGPEGKLNVGGEVTAPSLKAVQSNTEYAEGSGPRLALASAVWTGAIAALVCLALFSGQYHYLRGALPAAAGLAGGFFGGLAVGLVGGAAGQGLYLLAQGGSVLGTIFQVFGWTLLGGLAGAGLSLFIPNLKPVHGLAGGALGGAVGALGFIAVSAAAGDLVGRLVGGLLLGFCIGLMVAIVEAAFRRAWLEVRFGARETISVNLGPEPVKVGGDGRACTVWARGAPALALRYYVRNGRVICEDVPTRTESVVGNGDAREVGNVTVTVRTGSGSAPAAPPPVRRAATPPIPRTPPKAGKLIEAVPVEPEPIPLGEDDVVPMPLPPPPPPPPARPPAPPPPAAKPPAAPPPRPPVPTAGAKPPSPPKPAPKPVDDDPFPMPTTMPKPPGTRDPNACPTCGRVNAGRAGQRYCMVCDNAY